MILENNNDSNSTNHNLTLTGNVINNNNNNSSNPTYCSSRRQASITSSHQSLNSYSCLISDTSGTSALTAPQQKQQQQQATSSPSPTLTGFGDELMEADDNEVFYTLSRAGNALPASALAILSSSATATSSSHSSGHSTTTTTTGGGCVTNNNNNSNNNASITASQSFISMQQQQQQQQSQYQPSKQRALSASVSSGSNSSSSSSSPSSCEENGDTATTIFCIPLPSKMCSPAFKYLFCASGLFLFYILHAVALEYLFTEHLVSGFFLTLFQFVVYMSCAGVERIRSGQFSVRSASFRYYFLMSFFSVASMGLAYQALEYVTFPTQVIFKSCKLLAVMAAGVCITGRQYSFSEYVAALFLVSGLITLSLSSSAVVTVSTSTTTTDLSAIIFGDGLFGLSVNLTGVALLICALLADAFVGNMQEKVLNKNRATTAELVFFTHLLGIIWIVAICLFSGQLVNGIRFCIQEPHSVFVMLFYSILGYFGINFFMLMLKEFGVLIAVTTTTVRKVISLMLSFMLFPKPLSSSFILAAFLVFFGIALHIENKNRDTIRSLFQNPWRQRRRSDPKKQQV